LVVISSGVRLLSPCSCANFCILFFFFCCVFWVCVLPGDPVFPFPRFWEGVDFFRFPLLFFPLVAPTKPLGYLDLPSLVVVFFFGYRRGSASRVSARRRSYPNRPLPGPARLLRPKLLLAQKRPLRAECFFFSLRCLALKSPPIRQLLDHFLAA